MNQNLFFEKAIEAFITARTIDPNFLNANAEYRSSSEKVQSNFENLSKEHSELKEELFKLERDFDCQLSMTEKVSYRNGFQDAFQLFIELLFKKV